MNAPGATPDVTYSYDNFGRLTAATQPGHALGFTYDALGRRLTETGPLGTVSSQYRADGARTRLTHPDGVYFHRTYFRNGALYQIFANATSGSGARLGQMDYDTLNRPERWYAGSGSTQRAIQYFEYDPVSRMDELRNDLSSAASPGDVTTTFGFNPASQIANRTRTDDAYASDGQSAGTTNYTPNGLNQYSTINPPGSGSITLQYDPRGNLTQNGTSSYSYDALNRLIGSDVGGQITAYAYDPLGRLYSVDASGSANDRRYQWDGDSIIVRSGALTGALAIQERYVHTPGSLGAPVTITNRAGVAAADRQYVQMDERGSVVSMTNGATGAQTAINTYGPYGEPGPGNSGPFGYAGQLWIPEAGLYYMRNRMYDPTLGRFLQTDPIGYAGGMNLYGYVGGDPVNRIDPMGLCGTGEATVGASRLCRAIDPNSLFPGVTIIAGPSGTNFAAARRGKGESVGAIASSPATTAANYAQRFGGGYVSDTERVGGYSRFTDRVIIVNAGGIRQTQQTFGNLLNDSQFMRQLTTAWAMSAGHRGRQGTHEHAFWARENEDGNVTVYPIVGAVKDNPHRIYPGVAPDGARIFVHTHPFRERAPYFSGGDLGTAQIRGLLMIVYSHDGFFIADFRN